MEIAFTSMGIITLLVTIVWSAPVSDRARLNAISADALDVFQFFDESSSVETTITPHVQYNTETTDAQHTNAQFNNAVDEVKTIEQLRMEIRYLKQKLAVAISERENEPFGSVDNVNDLDNLQDESVKEESDTQESDRERRSDVNNDFPSKFRKSVSEFGNGNPELEAAVQKHLEYFLSDLYSLFQYDVEKMSKEQKRTRHSRQRRLLSRPKRDLKSFMRMINYRKVLKQYFQKKGNDENGQHTFRFG